MSVSPLLTRVRSVVEESGYSQTALGKAKVATQAAISKWFTSDDTEPGSGALARLVVFLGINGHWLLTGRGDRYELSEGGADAVFDAGRRAGRREASEALAKLRAGVPETVSPLATKSAERSAASKAEVRKAQQAQKKPGRAG